MMTKKTVIYLLIVGASLLFVSFMNNQGKKYYYAFDDKITLISNPEIILVRYSEGVQKSEIIADMTTFSSSDLSIKWHDPLTVEISTKSTKEVKQLFEKLNQNEKIYSLHPLYVLEDGLEMG